MTNVIRLIRDTTDPKFGMTSSQWINDAVETLVSVCEEWLDETDLSTVDLDSPEQDRRKRISQVAINLLELLDRFEGIDRRAP